MTAPLQATSTEALSVATAGLYRVEIDTGTAGSPEWTEIKGLSKWAPKFEQETEDDRDLSSGAWKSEFPIGNGFSVALEGKVKGTEDPNFVIDPGVQALLEKSETYGKAGIGHFRFWRTDSIPEAREFYATVKVSKGDDAPPALQKFSGDLTGKGKPADIVKPSGAISKIFTIDSGVTGYTVTVDGQTTSSITTKTAAALKSALEALSTVGVGNVNTSGSSGGPLTAEFLVPVTTVTASGTGGTVAVSNA